MTDDDDITEDDATALIRHVQPWPVDHPYQSSFGLALREARTICDRDAEDGGKGGMRENNTIWSGAAIYLILLEQIGKTLRTKGDDKRLNEREMEAAVRMFGPPDIDEAQRRALYALRCCFVHQFGLTNSLTNPQYKHVFSLHWRDEATTLMALPKRMWNGELDDVSADTTTHVNLTVIEDVVEFVVAAVRAHAGERTLRARLAIRDLQQRFGVGLINN